MKRFVIRDVTKKENIVMDENLLFRLYCTFKGLELKEEQELENIIKIMLPDDEKEALEILLNGLKVEDKLFLPLVTSAGMQKKENQDEEDIDRRCEDLFIAEENKEFIELYEKLISLSKIEKLTKKEEAFCINKKITSRLGLVTSSTNKINYRPNIVILPSDNYTYISNYYIIENGKLKEKDNVEVEHTFADGCGFMSPKMAKIIQKQLKLDYKVDFAGIRMYNGTATKGLVIKCNFNKFFEEFYSTVADDKFFRKDKNGDFVTKDVFGKKANLSKADLILNENMCKWTELWKEEVERLKDINLAIEEELNKDIYAPYKSDLECLYVTKVNKKEVPTHTATSYQLINNLALTPKEMQKLVEPTEEYYRRVIDGDVDAIRLYLGELAREEMETISATTKCHKLLQFDEEFEKCGFIKKTVNALINKSVHQLAGGKFYVKGNYKTAFIDPVCYLKWIMNRSIEKSRELKCGEFYVPSEEGKRVINRNPQAAFSEAHKIVLVKTNLLERYFGKLTNELIFFNQVDDTAMTSSGEDFDLDFNGVWDDEIIYNSVIDPKEGRHYLNKEDGYTKEDIFSRESMYKAIIKSSGNLIGSIANMTTKISTHANRLGYIYGGRKLGYIDLKNFYKNHYSIKINCKTEEHLKAYALIKNIELTDDAIEAIKESGNKKEIEDMKKERYRLDKELTELFEKSLNRRVKKGQIIDVSTLNDNLIRKHLIENFYYEKTLEMIYYSLFQSQRAIDSSKTCIFPNKNDINPIKDFVKDVYYKKYPYFMYFAKWSKNYENKNRVDWENTSRLIESTLNKHAARISDELISKINDEKEYSKNNNKALKFLKSIAITNNEKCNEEVKKLYNEYTNETAKVRFIYKNIKATRENKKLTTEEKRERHRLLNALDLGVIEKMLYLEKEFTTEEIASAIVNSKCSLSFIINFAFTTLEKAILSSKENRAISKSYKEDDNGEIEFFFKRYSKVDCILSEVGDMTNKEYKNKLMNTKGLDIRIGDIKEDLKQDKKIKIAVEEYNGKEQFIITNSEDKKIGFIFNNKKLNVEQVRKAIGKEFKIKHIETKNKSATLFLVS